MRTTMAIKEATVTMTTDVDGSDSGNGVPTAVKDLMLTAHSESFIDRCSFSGDDFESMAAVFEHCLLRPAVTIPLWRSLRASAQPLLGHRCG